MLSCRSTSNSLINWTILMQRVLSFNWKDPTDSFTTVYAKSNEIQQESFNQNQFYNEEAHASTPMKPPTAHRMRSYESLPVLDFEFPRSRRKRRAELPGRAEAPGQRRVILAGLGDPKQQPGRSEGGVAQGGGRVRHRCHEDGQKGSPTSVAPCNLCYGLKDDMCMLSS